MVEGNNRHWVVREKRPTLLDRFVVSLPNFSPVLLQVLINRGIETVEEVRSFLDCSLERLHDPFSLPDMETAVARIIRAIESDEKIMVFGDYDADGVTGTALLVTVLRRLGVRVIYYLPERLTEGYGLNKSGIDRARSQGVRLLITVDCGVTDFAEIEYLRQLDIDVIITDHHEIEPEGLPAARMIINPRRSGHRYLFTELAGVGLAYKLAQALYSNLKRGNLGRDEYLDLVALGTVADVVPLTGENRILVKHGLSALMRTRNFGLQALIEEVKLGGKQITSSHLGYILGPRINASGRLGSAENAIKLLLTSSPAEAEMLAATLDQENRERQKLEGRVLREALALAEEQVSEEKARILVLGREDWHSGVAGIVASRLVDRFYRPALILATGEGLCRGSGRSIRNFHLRRALEECRELLEDFGGHEYACGFTVERGNLSAFRGKINEVASSWISDEDLIRQIDIDAEISFSELTEDFMTQMEKLSPFGAGNPRPTFLTRNLTLKSEPRQAGGENWRMWVTDGFQTFEARGYGQDGASWKKSLRRSFDLVYSPVERFWQGQKIIQLRVKDVR